MDILTFQMKEPCNSVAIFDELLLRTRYRLVTLADGLFVEHCPMAGMGEGNVDSYVLKSIAMPEHVNQFLFDTIPSKKEFIEYCEIHWGVLPFTIKFAWDQGNRNAFSPLAGAGFVVFACEFLNWAIADSYTISRTDLYKRWYVR